jgi:hypothetical protein
MIEFLGSSTAQAVIWGAALVAACVVAVFLVFWLRGRREARTPTANEMLTDFRALMEGGAISPSEFRQIKGVLGPRLQAETRAEDAEGKG